MPISREALEARNEAIKASRARTLERRKAQVCRTVTCKIDYPKLKQAQRDALNGVFRDAKHLTNDIILYEGDVFKDYRIPDSVQVRMPDGTYETRELDSLGSHMKQSILQRQKDNIKGLAALKRNGHRVGALRPVKSVDSIPLKQNGGTFRLDGNYIRIQKVPGYMHLTGTRRLRRFDEVGSATLIRKPYGYFVAFCCYRDRTQYEAEQGAKREARRSRVERVPVGGLDANLTNETVESDGTVSNHRYPETRKAKLLQRRMSRRDKSSNGWKRANRQYRREQDRLRVQRDMAALAEFIRLTDKYEVLAIQDESIAAWGKRDGYVRGGRKLQGGILGRLYALLRAEAKEPTIANSSVVVLDKWQPTTSWCWRCGRRTPHEPGRQVFECTYCHLREDRDVHAARNMTRLARQPIPAKDLMGDRSIPIGPYVGEP